MVAALAAALLGLGAVAPAQAGPTPIPYLLAPLGTISISPDDAVKAGQSQTITVTWKDSYGRIVNTGPAASLALVLPESGLLTQSSEFTQEADGSYSATVTSQVAGSYPVSATWRSAPVGAAAPDVVMAVFKAGDPAVAGFDCPANAASTNLTVDPAKLTVGGTATATALITDMYCNPVPGVNVAFTVTGSASATTDATTGPGGLAATAVTDATAESVTLTATIAEQVLTGQAITFTAPPAPPTIDAPHPGRTVVSDQPQIAGTAPAGDVTVSVTDNGQPVEGCIDVPVRDGRWSCYPSNPLAQGPHALVAVAAASSGPATINVDTTRPNITRPGANTSLLTTKPKVAGTAPGDEGASVTVTDENDNPVCTATVKDGGWSCSTRDPLAPGAHRLKATVTDDSGNSLAGDPVAITVNVTPPVINVPEDGSVTRNPTPTISGTGNAPKDAITVSNTDSSTICSTTVNDDGTWSCVPSQPLADGTYAITATESDRARNATAPSGAVTFRVKTDAPRPPGVQASNGSRITGHVEDADDGTTVDVLGPDGPVPGCQDVPVSGGRWSCQPSTPPEPGTTISVITKDAPGNVSAPTSGTIRALGIEIQFPQRKPGEPQQVIGSNFNPGETVTCTIQSDPVVVGTGTAQPDGTVAIEFTVDPSQVRGGTHVATLTGSESGSVTADFQVAGPFGDTGPGGWQTGGGMLTLLPFGLLAVALLVAGWSGLSVARRHRSSISTG